MLSDVGFFLEIRQAFAVKTTVGREKVLAIGPGMRNNTRSDVGSLPRLSYPSFTTVGSRPVRSGNPRGRVAPRRPPTWIPHPFRPT